MGFRTTMTTEDICLEVPKEFLDKYPYIRASKWNHPEKLSLPLTLDTEIKFYELFEETEIFKDIQKLIIEQHIKDVQLVLFHECGGITKVIIYQDKIVGMEPTEWKQVSGVSHDYCYGCSELNNGLKLL